MKKKFKIGITCTIMAAVIAAGGIFYTAQNAVDIPELVSYVDDDLGETVQIEEEETPLATNPVTTTKTSTKTNTKKYKMKSKATKTKTTTTTNTKTTNKTSQSSTKKVATKTTVKTTTKTSYKKKSYYKTVQTTVKTTVKTTTTLYKSNASSSSDKYTKASSSSTNKNVKEYVSITKIAPKAHAQVLKAFQTLNFEVLVDSSVSYSGKFSARNQLITVHTNSDEAIYHELGHFVSFMAGNADSKSEFTKIYNAEKDAFTATRNNRSYIISTASEYFAESYQDYLERPAVLKSARPQTYAYIEKCLSNITNIQITAIKAIYGF